jgi:hypothetical protein
MKKTITLLFCLLTAIIVQAQTGHLKFMGIPLNGTITQFQTKLMAKGAKPDAKMNKELSAGCRMFKGVFAGDDAEFYVYYNTKTKIVYRAKAVIMRSNGEKGKEKLLDLKYMLQRKYPEAENYDGEQDGYPNFLMYLKSDKGSSLGTVGLYISKSGYSFIEDVGVHVDYIDFYNNRKNEEKEMDDL